jgi:hypothetical protein
MLFKEVIHVYREIERNTQIQNEELLIAAEAGWTYNYHWALKG